MKRDIQKLTGKQFDVLVIGAGIYGATLAWECARRGLSVAIIDRGDFGAATSFNSLRIIHGGLRYLQHLDFRRMKESLRERGRLMAIAPNLVRPLPCLMPTYSEGIRRKSLLSVAIRISDWMAKLFSPSAQLPKGRALSKADCLNLAPGVRTEGLTGGVLWYDAQVLNSEKLTFAFIKASHDAGAVVCNYMEAVELQKEDKKLVGVTALDLETGSAVTINARLVVNTTGPWINRLINKSISPQRSALATFTRAMNLVVQRKLVNQEAVAASSPGGQVFFVTPWNDFTLVGTKHLALRNQEEGASFSNEEVDEFIQSVNQAFPAAQLKRDEVVMVLGGLLPGSEKRSSDTPVNLLKHYEIVDHGQVDGIAGLWSVIGVKYTTARGVSEVVARRATYYLKKGEASPADYRFSEGPEDPKESGEKLAKRAAQEMMAIHLADAFFRRTNLWHRGLPNETALDSLARAMGEELDWSHSQIEKEKDSIRTALRTWIIEKASVGARA